MPDQYVIPIREDLGSWGLSKNAFIAQLESIPNDAPVLLRIACDGGDCFDASAMLSALQRRSGHKTAEIESLAASAASYLIMGCDTIKMHQHSFVMVHCATCGAIDNAKGLRKLCETLDAVDDMISGLYAARTGGERRSWRAAMERETWFSADEFRRLGLATIIPSKGPGESVANNRALANRSVRNQSIVDRLINERTTPRRPSVSAAEVMRFAARVRDDQFQYERQLNRETIIRNARSPERAQRYLRWS